MPHTHNELNAADQDCLAQLTAMAQREHLAVGCALGNALAHAMAAGDALLAARELVSPGSWQAHLRKHDISERSARVYILVAKARAVLERQSSAGPLSIAAALAYLKDPGAAEKKPAAKSRHKATSFDALGWWGGLTREEREHFLGHFLEDAGLTETLAAMPSAMRTELMRRAHAAAIGLRREEALTSAFKTALSLAKTDPEKSVNGIISALRGIRNLLTAEGFDPDRIDRVVIEAGKAEKPAKHAA
jgi:hypothetical protein